MKDLENVRKRVSFDFDSTLSIASIQEYAKMLIDKGIEVWIVTRRYDSEDKYTLDFLKEIQVEPDELKKQHAELFEIADRLGIKREHIVFMNMNPKYLFFKDNPDFVWHLDDDWTENLHITEFTTVKAVTWFGNRDWKTQCSRMLFD